MNSLIVKTGDLVVVITGKDAGKQGKVLAVNTKTNRITVEGEYERKASGRACCLAVARGSGKFECGERTIEIKAGDCLFEPAKTDSYLVKASDGDTLEILECTPPKIN